MVRANPLTQLQIQTRKEWPETRAALSGPKNYDELGGLTSEQRNQLVEIAKVAEEERKPFLEAVICQGIQYRLEQKCCDQERPATIAAAMRKVIRAAKPYLAVVSQAPHSVLSALGAPLLPEGTAEDWLVRAEEKTAQLEREIEGHTPSLVTDSLKIHAWALQKIAHKYSKHLRDNRKAMKDWLRQTLFALGEPRPGRKRRKSYFEALMLPECPKHEANSMRPGSSTRTDRRSQ